MTRIYDQGGESSFLGSALNWTTVSGKVNVGEGTDYLVTYAAFSRDGSSYSLSNEFADLDNFSLTSSGGIPEPATIAMLGFGGLFLIKRKKC